MSSLLCICLTPWVISRSSKSNQAKRLPYFPGTQGDPQKPPSQGKELSSSSGVSPQARKATGHSRHDNMDIRIFSIFALTDQGGPVYCACRLEVCFIYKPRLNLCDLTFVSPSTSLPILPTATMALGRTS